MHPVNPSILPDVQLYQQQLADSERRFRSLVQNGSDMMCIIEPNGKYLYVTEHDKNAIGYQSGSFTGKNAFEFIHPLDAPIVFEQLINLSVNQTIALKPFRFRAPDGEYRWIEGKVTNLTNDPAIGGLVVNSRDITEKKAIQELLDEQILKERQEIGKELHDNVNQILSTVKLYLRMSSDPLLIKEDLVPKAAALIQECIQEIRQISSRLVKPVDTELPLNEAIRLLVNSIALAGTIECHYESHNLEACDAGEELQLAMYRITQEQVSNILTHAQASVVDVTLACIDQSLILTITDNGVGFDPLHKYPGIGMSNMHQRAGTVNGQLQITSAAGAGCTLTATFPL